MMSDDPTAPASGDDCMIPPPVEPEALERYLLKQSPYDGSDEIRSYVEGQSPDEQVTYVERISGERVLGNDHEIWDVHTTGERYWVITRPTNLYSQRLFPSADYTLTFHVGLMARVASRERGHADDEQRNRVASAWRRWMQAAEALDQAHEAEEFQAVGMRCRECLLDLARSIAEEPMVPPGREAPKSGDFIHWSELIAEALVGGPSAREVRSYLKTITKSAWQLVSWLTHASNAVRLDGEMAVEAAHSVVVAFAAAVIRFEQGIPSRCPQCNSYKMATRYLTEIGADGMYACVCESCGWRDPSPGDTRPEPGAPGENA